MLERELASYNSQSDLDDLHAILDRYSEQETRTSAASWPSSTPADPGSQSVLSISWVRAVSSVPR